MVSARAMFSRTVNVSSKFESWKTNPSSSRRKRESSLDESVVMSRPATRMEPLVTTSIVDMQFKSVDLPEPDGPMIHELAFVHEKTHVRKGERRQLVSAFRAAVAFRDVLHFKHMTCHGFLLSLRRAKTRSA